MHDPVDAQEKQASVALLGDLEAAEVNWSGSPCPAVATEPALASLAPSDERSGEGLTSPTGAGQIIVSGTCSAG